MSRRNRFVLILMLLVGLGIFGYSLRNVKLSSLLRDLANLRWQWFIIALVCICMYLILESLVVKTFMADRLSSFTFKEDRKSVV